MYRYSDKKNRRDNQRLRQKQLNKSKRRVTPALKRRQKSASKAPTAKKSSLRREKKTSVSTKTRAQRPSWRWPNWLTGWLRILGSVVVVIILIGATLILCFNSFLPLIFELKQERVIMLVGNTPEQASNQFYLVRMLPQAQSVSVLELNQQMMVPVAGQYGQYPLETVGSFLTAEGQGVSEIRKTYNLAFEQTVDLVYYLPEMAPIATKADLTKVLEQYLKQSVLGKGDLGADFWPIFFSARANVNYNFARADQLDQVRTWGSGVSEKPALTACPVVLFNAANSQGLATRVSQILEQNGLEIRHLDNAAEVAAQTTIYYDENSSDCLKVVQTVQTVLPKDIILIPDGGEEAKKNRGKTAIFLGEAIAE